MHYNVLKTSHLFESLKYFLPLSKMPEQELEGSRHQRGVVVHPEVQEDPEERFAPGPVQIEDCTVLAVKRW